MAKWLDTILCINRKNRNAILELKCLIKHNLILIYNLSFLNRHVIAIPLWKYVLSILSAKYRTRPPSNQLPSPNQQSVNEPLSSNAKSTISTKQPDSKSSPITGIGKGPPTVSCDNCGGLQMVTWKGGGYNMT